MKENIKSIMLIDDEEVSVYINKKIIDASKIANHVQTFFSAIHALDYLKLIQDENTYYNLFAPQVILLDNNMPYMTGFEFLDEFRKLSFFHYKQIDIFMISSSESSTDIQNAMSKGCSGYIVKPLTTEKILTHMKNIIR